MTDVAVTFWQPFLCHRGNQYSISTQKSINLGETLLKIMLE